MCQIHLFLKQFIHECSARSMEKGVDICSRRSKVKRGTGREITCPDVAAWYGSDHPPLRSFLKQVLLLLWGCHGGCVGGGRRALDPFFRGEEEGTVGASGRGRAG